MCKFKIGDKVQRDERDTEFWFVHCGIILKGTIINVYGKIKKQYTSDLTLGPYPELYLVEWGNHPEGKSISEYLPHGIDSL